MDYREYMDNLAALIWEDNIAVADALDMAYGRGYDDAVKDCGWTADLD